MKRRKFSLSLLSALSALPLAARQLLASSVRLAEGDIALTTRAAPAQPPASTVTFLPIGFEERPFRVTPVSATGELVTKEVTLDLSFIPGPPIRLMLQLPLIEDGAFPSIATSQPFQLVSGVADFGDTAGMLPYSAIAVKPTHTWMSTVARVSAFGEMLTVRTIDGQEAPVVVAEELGTSELVEVSPRLRQLLMQQGVDVDELLEHAKAPKLRQRVMLASGGGVGFRVPDPPLPLGQAVELRTIQVTLWSPVPIAVMERTRSL